MCSSSEVWVHVYTVSLHAVCKRAGERKNNFLVGRRLFIEDGAAVEAVGSLAPRHLVPCVLCEDFPGCIALSGNTKDKSFPQMSVCLPTLPAGGPSCRARLRHWFGTPGSGCKRNPKGIYIHSCQLHHKARLGLSNGSVDPSMRSLYGSHVDPCMDPI